MQCRNCEHYSDSEFRYCPRCGAPSSLGWPMAGAPWLRRPAAIAGLAILIVAWLFALQRALWVPARSPDGRVPATSAPVQEIVRTPDAPAVPEQSRPATTDKQARIPVATKPTIATSIKPAPRTAPQPATQVAARPAAPAPTARTGRALLADASVTITPRPSPAVARRAAGA